MIKAIALLRAGDTDEGIAFLRAAMKPYHAQGGDLCRSYFCAMLAEGMTLVGAEHDAL